MNDKTMECLGDRGFKTYNSLREFYDEPERREILEHIIKYATEEMNFLGIEDDKTFREKVRLRGYSIVKKVYDLNMQRIRAGKGAASLRFPTNEQIREQIKARYKNLEKKLIGEE